MNDDPFPRNLHRRELDRHPPYAVVVDLEHPVASARGVLVPERSRLKKMMRPLSLCLALSVAACTKKADSPPPPAAPPPVEADAQAQPATAPIALRDASTIEDAAPGPMIAGLFGQSPIMSDMDWPVREKEGAPPSRNRPERKGAVRIGYIRQGGLVAVVPE